MASGVGIQTYDEDAWDSWGRSGGHFCCLLFGLLFAGLLRCAIFQVPNGDFSFCLEAYL